MWMLFGSLMKQISSSSLAWHSHLHSLELDSEIEIDNGDAWFITCQAVKIPYIFSLFISSASRRIPVPCNNHHPVTYFWSLKQ